MGRRKPDPTIQASVVRLVLERMARGDSLRGVCREEREKDPAFPTEATVRLWAVNDDPKGFALQYARAREAQADAWSDEILEIADDTSGDTLINTRGEERADQEWINRSRLRVDSRKWLMSKLHPGRYGEHLDLTSGGAALHLVIEGGGLKVGKGK